VALEDRLEKGEVKLTYAADGHGYLASLLAALNISPESQVLPFTRSSLQFDHINPKAPRAVYFNDDVAVSVVHEGAVIEILSNDLRGGIAFYTLDTAKADTPQLSKQGGRCAVCHGLVNTAAPNMKHLGNITAPDPAMPFDLPPEGGRTLASLEERYDLKQTLRPTSDIVALMTLEHQAGFTNRAYALNVQYSDAALDDLVAYMTFDSEVKLPGPISGNSGFTAMFAARGPRDAKGRSLRDFDLKTRLFRYPLSYMIYSSTFDTLKPDIRAKLLRKLYDVLRAKGEDGAAAIAIMAATKPGLPDYWK
jgi:hypothetical protein